MTSYSKVLERAASTLEWMPGAAQEARRSDAAALRALAGLVAEAEALAELGMTMAARPRRLALLQSLAAGFHTGVGGQ